MMQNLKIGDVLPIEGKWRIVGAPLVEPEWFALRVMGGREAAATERLVRSDIEVAYPTETTVSYRNGKKYKITKAMVPGLIYAKFRHEPMWHNLRDRRIVTGVVCRDNMPISLPPDVIRRILHMPLEADRLTAAKLEMLRIREGDKARILTGPLSGFVVDVRSIKDKRVWWASFFGKGEASIVDLERVVDTLR
jgi:transcription antitermination factor NusG